MAATGETAPAEAESEAAPQAAGSWIAARNLDRGRRGIEGLSERGRRFGTGSIELRVLNRTDREVLVELSGQAPRLAGWEVVGRLDHNDGGPGLRE